MKIYQKVAYLFTLAVFFFASTVQAQPMVGKDCVNISERPLSDFIDAQGTSSDFFPPVKDYSGWVDADSVFFGLVDYAGLADEYIEEETGSSLGTKVKGLVLECVLADGTARISVNLATSKALGFAQSIDELANNNFDFLNTPTVFGAKAQEVVADGAEPALGPAHLTTSFIIDVPGGPLPDIATAFNDNAPDVRPYTFDFRSATVGALPDGARARLLIQQVCAADVDSDQACSREIVDLNKQVRGED